MANKKLWMGMLVLMLAFGMMIIGCDEFVNCECDNGSTTINCGCDDSAVVSCGCDDSTVVSCTCVVAVSDLNGTWISITTNIWGEYVALRFDNGTYLTSSANEKSDLENETIFTDNIWTKSNYFIINGRIIFNRTHIHGNSWALNDEYGDINWEPRLYSRDEIISLLELGDNYFVLFLFDNRLDFNRVSTADFILVDDVLTIFWSGDIIMSYIRQ